MRAQVIKEKVAVPANLTVVQNVVRSGTQMLIVPFQVMELSQIHIMRISNTDPLLSIRVHATLENSYKFVFKNAEIGRIDF